MSLRRALQIEKFLDVDAAYIDIPKISVFNQFHVYFNLLKSNIFTTSSTPALKSPFSLTLQNN
jgi:hypothetical protein